MGGFQVAGQTIRPIGQPDVLQNYGRLAQLRGLQQEQQIQAQAAPYQQQILQEAAAQAPIQTQNMQQDQQDNASFRAAMQDPSMRGKTIGQIADVLAQNGKISQKAWVGAKDADLKSQQTLGTMADNNLKTLDTAYKSTQPIYDIVQRMDDQTLAANWPTIAQQYDAIWQPVIAANPQLKANMPILNPNQPMTKAQIAQFGPMLSMGQAYTDAENKRRKDVADTQSAELDAQQKKQNLQYGPIGQAADAKYSFLQKKIALHQTISADDQAWMKGYEKQKTLVPVTRINMMNANSGSGDSPEPDKTNPDSQSILAQTGLSLNAFRALTGQSSQLPRDRFTRNQANREAQAWANKNGVDVSTMAAQYKANNSVLEANIARMANTKIMENEMQGTIKNLQGVAQGADLSRVNFANVVKIWAGQQVNDNLAQQYAMHLNQLRNELAAYNAATQGRSGSSIMLQDLNEADKVLRNGMASGSLEGLSTAVENSTQKMKGVMENSVDAARQAVWDLFGVGGKYKKMYSGGSGEGGSKGVSVGQIITQGGHKFKVTSVDANGKPTAADPVQ